MHRDGETKSATFRECRVVGHGPVGATVAGVCCSFAADFTLGRGETRRKQRVPRAFAADFLQNQQTAAGTGKTGWSRPEI
jgi:hypothetical protein